MTTTEKNKKENVMDAENGDRKTAKGQQQTEEQTEHRIVFVIHLTDGGGNTLFSHDFKTIGWLC